MLDPETEYLMLRAEDEAILAIRAAHPAAAAAHQQMAISYSTRAVRDLAEARAGLPRPGLASRAEPAILPVSHAGEK